MLYLVGHCPDPCSVTCGHASNCMNLSQQGRAIGGCGHSGFRAELLLYWAVVEWKLLQFVGGCRHKRITMLHCGRYVIEIPNSSFPAVLSFSNRTRRARKPRITKDLPRTKDETRPKTTILIVSYMCLMAEASQVFLSFLIPSPCLKAGSPPPYLHSLANYFPELCKTRGPCAMSLSLRIT